MRFEVKTRLNFQNLVLLNAVVDRINYPWKANIFRPILCAAGALLAVSCCTVQYRNGASLGLMLLTELGLLLFLWGLLLPYAEALFSRLVLPKGTGNEAYVFTDKHFTVQDAKGETTQEYSAIVALYRCQNCCFLFLSPQYAFILPDGAFQKGSAADFRQFIQEKTGKVLQSVR